MFSSVEMNAPVDRGLKHSSSNDSGNENNNVEMNAPIDRGLKLLFFWLNTLFFVGGNECPG